MPGSVAAIDKFDPQITQITQIISHRPTQTDTDFIRRLPR